ncbi:MAG: DinB family protein [Gemmatimonadota bacterium]
MSLTDRPAVVAALEANLRHIERVVAHADPATSALRPTPDEWSVLEILEHLTVVERAVHKAITTAAGEAPGELRTRQKDAMVAGLASYPAAVSAPEMVHPKGRYESLADALRIFRERRNTTLDLARSLDVAWDAHHFAHPLLGRIDLGQWFLMAATHGERHAVQIEQRR